jgi:hypothetical protein
MNFDRLTGLSRLSNLLVRYKSNSAYPNQSMARIISYFGIQYHHKRLLCAVRPTKRKLKWIEVVW